MGVVRTKVLVLLLVHTWARGAEGTKELPVCDGMFQEGRKDFVLNTERSVTDGATYIDNPNVHTSEECLKSCCAHAQCNLALVQLWQNTTYCFLFDCLYRNQFICSFSRKPGFYSFILDQVYLHYLASPSIGTFHCVLHNPYSHPTLHATTRNVIFITSVATNWVSI